MPLQMNKFLLRPLEQLRSIVMSMSVRVSDCLRGYLWNHMRDLYQIFVHDAYVCGSVLLRHVDDRPHCLSGERVTGVHSTGKA